MDRQAIAAKATQLHEGLKKMLPALGLSPDQPVRELLHPKHAAELLSIDYHEVAEIPSDFPFRGDRFRIAGLLDRRRALITVATASTPEETRFTAAHEIGHWVLHQDQIVMHRDRPIRATALIDNGRALVEKEADYFAACYLMPARAVRAAVATRFGALSCGQLKFDDSLAYHLDPCDPVRLLSAEADALVRELEIARFTGAHGDRFLSLAQEFGVSPTAMAIRLQELDLVRWP